MDTTREEHLKWCKQRAFEYIEQGDLEGAFASMTSDINKHPETSGHAALGLGAMLLVGGHLNTPERMRKFIEDFS